MRKTLHSLAGISLAESTTASTYGHEGELLLCQLFVKSPAPLLPGPLPTVILRASSAGEALPASLASAFKEQLTGARV